MAEAFGTIGNSGVYQKPLTFTRITDANGNVILDMKLKQVQSQSQAFKPGTAYMLIDMLTDAVNSGTGTAARIKGMTVAGKTGTHSDYKSVFFAGLTPYYSGAVWVGHDEFKSLYRGATGGKEAAPIWQTIMQRLHEAYELENKPIIDADPSDLGLTKVTLCSLTGKLATAACEADADYPPTTDWCHVDSIPTETCDLHVTVSTDTTSGLFATAGCLTNAQDVSYQIVPSSWGCDDMEDEKFLALFPHGIRGYENAEAFRLALESGLLPQEMYCSLHSGVAYPDYPDDTSSGNVFPSYSPTPSTPEEDDDTPRG